MIIQPFQIRGADDPATLTDCHCHAENSAWDRTACGCVTVAELEGLDDPLSEGARILETLALSPDDDGQLHVFDHLPEAGVPMTHLLASHYGPIDASELTGDGAHDLAVVERFVAAVVEEAMRRNPERFDGSTDSPF